MPLPAILQKLRIPLVCAPMFIAGSPKAEYGAARRRLQMN